MERNDGIIVQPVRTVGSQRLLLGVLCFALLTPLFALLLSGCGPTGSTVEEDAPRDGAGRLDDHGPVVTVARVVDGDTVEVAPAVDGLTEVRLIGVDTPETKDPRTGVQPYGEEASRFTTNSLEGERVALEFDVEKTDRYGRLLAYVWLPDDRMFNEVLLKKGYAQMATFPPNVRYVERFVRAQREAREAGRGLWGLSEEQLCQQTDRGNRIGGGCGADGGAQEPPSPPGPSDTGGGGDLDEKRWLESFGALVAATPRRNTRRAWPEKVCRWVAGRCQLIEGVIWQLKDHFGLGRHRAKTMNGLLTRLAAKVAAYTGGQALNAELGRPLRHLADLLV